MRILVMLALWAAMFPAKTGGPDFSGTWKYNPDKTTAHRAWTGDTVVVVRQSGQQISFDYYSGHENFAHESYTTDGKERPLYKTKTETAYARAHWEKSELQIATQHVYDAQGTQESTDVDRWLLADGGKTLVNQLSDGKKVVFDKVNESGH